MPKVTSKLTTPKAQPVDLSKEYDIGALIKQHPQPGDPAPDWSRIISEEDMRTLAERNLEINETILTHQLETTRLLKTMVKKKR
jgi:hypothetical protein